MIDMASAVPPSACEPVEKREDGNGGASLAQKSRAFRQTKRRDQTIGLFALAVHEFKAPESNHGHGGGHEPGFGEAGYNTGESDHKADKCQSQSPKSSYLCLGKSYCGALFGGKCGQYSVFLLMMLAYAHMGALAQSGTQALAMAPYVSASAFLMSWIRVLAITAMIAQADGRALPPYHSAQIGSGSNTAISSNDLGNDSPPKREPGPESHGTNWGLWVTLAIAFISLLGGAEAWATFRGERVRQIRAMGYVCVFTLAVAAAPIVLHEAGGIEAEVKGPLLALWAGGHLNFVLRGATLVRHEQAGYLSPLGYVGVLAVLSHLVFSAADKQNSRLYTTLTTLLVTILQDVGIRASFGGPQTS
jgi:hypothetical protein